MSSKDRLPFRTVCLLGLCLGVSTFLLYLPVRTHEFQLVDDLDYVVRNAHVNRGLNLPDVVWAFTHGHSSNWHPITWLSHMLDCQLFGVTAGAHLLINVAFHAVNSMLLIILLYRLTGAVWRSLFVAAFFAFHPLHVESVAWVAERKDVLSTMFFLLTLLAYSAYATRTKSAGQTRGSEIVGGQNGEQDKGRWLCYGSALVLFALGLMSKPMLVTLPFVLLLIDFWPLGRLQLPLFARRTSTLNSPEIDPPPLIILLIEKLPFFAFAIASSVITLRVQEASGAVVSTAELPMDLRLANAILSYVRYLRLMFVPANLSVFYPIPKAFPPEQIAGALLLLIALTSGATFLARQKPYLLVGWLWYLGTLLPVIGIIKAGEQAIADRYTYIPLIGLFIALCWLAHETIQRFMFLRMPISLAGIALTGSCALFASRQIALWKDSRTLYQHAAQVTQHNYAAMMVLGSIFWEQGKVEEAKAHTLKGLEDAPRSPNLRVGLGFILIAEKHYEDALSNFQQALAVSQESQPASYGKGYCLYQLGRFSESEEACQRAWSLDPADHKAGMLLVLALQSQHNNEAAEATCRELLRRKPAWPPALRCLAGILKESRKLEDSLKIYLEAVAAEPKNIEGLNGFAEALAEIGKLGESAEQYTRSLQIAPDQALTHCTLAQLLSNLNRGAEAIQHYRDALRLQPELGVALNNLAWLLATSPDPKLRNGQEAVILAEHACRTSHQTEPFFLGTLAAAYAEAGRFSDAIRTAQQARDLATKTAQAEIAKRNDQLLDLYKAGKPYRESALTESTNTSPK